MLPRGKLETEPGCLHTLYDSVLPCHGAAFQALVGTSPQNDICIVFLAEGVRILPSHLVGFTKRLLLRAVCSFGQFVLFLLQVNNSVVHTSFHLHGEPIKVSLVMESTLTRFVYF